MLLNARLQVHGLLHLLVLLVHLHVLRILGLLFHFLLLLVVLQHDLVHGLPLALAQYRFLRRIYRIQLFFAFFRIFLQFLIFVLSFHISLLQLALNIIHLQANRLSIRCAPHIVLGGACQARLAEVPAICYMLRGPAEADALFLDRFIKANGLIQVALVFVVVVYLRFALQKDVGEHLLAILSRFVHF